MKTKVVNRSQISKKNAETQADIGNAMYLENLGLEGKTPESLISEVKGILGVEANQSLAAESEAALIQLNKLQKNFVDLNSLTVRLIDDKLIDEAGLAVLNSIESKLADELVSIYDLDIEDLYEVEDE